MNRRQLISRIITGSVASLFGAKALSLTQEKEMTPNVVISMPSQLFTLSRKFQAASNGKIYIGKIDTDPTIPENQIQVYLENEDGSTIPVAQPLIINQAGFPVYNGQIAKFVTVEGHSMAVYDSYGAQQFYYPNVLKYDPDQFEQRFKRDLVNPFSNVSEMLSATNLKEGLLLHVMGYNAPADGGAASFVVVSKDSDIGMQTKDGRFKVMRSSGHDWLHRIIRNGQTPRVVAHRGWSSISPGEPAGDNQIVNFVPENTKEAVRFCAERGAFGIEGDTKISKDGVPVIFHDYNLSRVTKGVHTGAIESYTYDELKAMDVGSYVSAKYKDARIMNYDEWLGECKRCSIMPVAEWSAPMTEQQANDLILIIKKYYGEQHSDVFVSSTYPETLKLLRRKSAYLGLGVMGGYGATIDEGRWELAYELGNSAIHLNGKSVLNMTEVNKAKEMGLLIFTGIPNSTGRIEQCIQAGVDVIVPDFYRG